MAKILSSNLESYKIAAAHLRRGELAVLPTETVYGLAALANNEQAIANIYKVKNRPKNKLLSCVVLEKKAANKIAKVSPLAQELMDKFWPGPLTLVLPSRDKKNQTIAIRCPDTRWARAFTNLGFTQTLVLPSANTSGKTSPSTAAQVEADLGSKIPLIIDGGKVNGLASTILAIKTNRIVLLRAGALRPEELAAYKIEFSS